MQFIVTIQGPVSPLTFDIDDSGDSSLNEQAMRLFAHENGIATETASKLLSGVGSTLSVIENVFPDADPEYIDEDDIDEDDIDEDDIDEDIDDEDIDDEDIDDEDIDDEDIDDEDIDEIDDEDGSDY